MTGLRHTFDSFKTQANFILANYFTRLYDEFCFALYQTISFIKVPNNDPVKYESLSYFRRRYLELKITHKDLSSTEWVWLLFSTLCIAGFRRVIFNIKNYNKTNAFITFFPNFFIYMKKLFKYITTALFGTLEYTRRPRLNYTTANLLFLKGNFARYRKFTPIFTPFAPVYNYVIVFYRGLRTLVLPLVVVLLVSQLLVNYFSINIFRQLGAWIIVGLIFFWLISGFNFFIKRYRFGKFTSAIQRFWKRTNTYFWLIEGFLFSLFFYYYLNSSQEPLYMYDESALNQTHLFSLVNAYFSYILLVFLIWYCYYVLLNLVNFNARQNTTHLLVITLGLIYIYLLENYQFYYVITSFYENYWVFDAETNAWALEVDTPRVRVKQQYLILALIAKYWHFLFIFLSWLFFFVKCFEQKRVSFVFFGVNLQNLIILFGLNFVFNIQWLKWLSRRYLDVSYYWFFADPNYWASFALTNEVTNLVGSFLVFNCSVYKPLKDSMSYSIFLDN